MSLVPRDYYYYGTRRSTSLPAFPHASRSFYRIPTTSLIRSETVPTLQSLDYYLPYRYRPYGTWRYYRRYYDWDLYPYYTWERWPAHYSYWPYYYYYQSPRYYSYYSWLSSPYRSWWAYDYYYYPRYRALNRYAEWDWPYWRSYADLNTYRWWARPYSWYYYNKLERDRGFSLYADNQISYDTYDRYWLRPSLYSPTGYHRYWYLY